MVIKKYITDLFFSVPEYVYMGILSVLFICSVIIIATVGFKRGWRILGGIALVIYIFLIYSFTVIFRTSTVNRTYNFRPFWSYEAFLNGEHRLMIYNAMNVIAFIPLGLLIGAVFRYVKWWQVLLIGILISASVEALQLYLNKGFAEIDDVFHNVLGCMIGFGLYFMMQEGLQKLSKNVNRTF